MTEETAATIDLVTTDLGITEGRLGISVEGEAGTIRLRTPMGRMLSRHEPVLTLEAVVDLEAVDFDRDVPTGSTYEVAAIAARLTEAYHAVGRGRSDRPRD